MIDLSSKNALTFTKKLKYVTNRDKALKRSNGEFQKTSSSAGKYNSPKFSEKSRSKNKIHEANRNMKVERSPKSQDINNAESQKFIKHPKDNNKVPRTQNLWSVETSVQTKTFLNLHEDMEKHPLRKQRSCRDYEREEKKDRKFSENVRNVAQQYEILKEEHILQKKLMVMALNEKELHRLDKMYEVEETQYLIRVLNADRKEQK